MSKLIEYRDRFDKHILEITPCSCKDKENDIHD